MENNPFYGLTPRKKKGSRSAVLQVTQEYRVKGPVMITTTAVALDKELLSRCLVITVAKEAP